MTYPRSHTVNPAVSGSYLVTTRCVRRAWLCGEDEATGLSFEHRKSWIEDKIHQLAGTFSIDVDSYAVMSNHYHVVVTTHPEKVTDWSDLEIANRWLQLCRIRTQELREKRLAAILASPKRLTELRERLGCLSWFMRYINEPVARMANKEDGCTGKFWEGRFNSKALLDDAAVTAAMAYVDLNPVRAGISPNAETAKHTALGCRMRELNNARLAALESKGLTLAGYRKLVEWTADADTSGRVLVDQQVTLISRSLSRTPEEWLNQFKLNRSRFRAYGSATALRRYAAELGQKWVHGCNQAPSQ